MADYFQITKVEAFLNPAISEPLTVDVQFTGYNAATNEVATYVTPVAVGDDAVALLQTTIGVDNLALEMP